MTTTAVLIVIALALAFALWKFPAVSRVVGGAGAAVIHTILVRLMLLAVFVLVVALLIWWGT